jgi:hypothetical protein
MAEQELDRRLLAVARTLDADTPAFDPAILSVPDRRRGRWTFVALAAVAALVGMTVTPGARSALADLFGVESVPELGRVAPDVAPPFLGRQVAMDAAEATVPFHVRTIGSLGAPDAVYVRDDIVGGMVMVAYEGGRLRLSQWRSTDVDVRATVVRVRGTADDVTIGYLRGLWIAGSARGTFTVVGADRTIHHEAFDVDEGVLLWQEEGAAFLLQGAGTRTRALALAAEITR